MSKLNHIIKTTALAATIVCSVNAEAGFITYNDEAAWNTAIGTSVAVTENFNSLTKDISFKNTPLSINDLKISGPLGYAGAGNKIDVPGFDFDGTYDVDGTAYVLADLNGLDTLRVDFNQGVSAWGASFRGISNSPRDTVIRAFDTNNNLLGTIITISASDSNAVLSFYGFALGTTEAASYLIFENLTQKVANDVFGIDNIRYVTASPVPEPSTFAMLGFGLAALTFARKRKAS